MRSCLKILNISTNVCLCVMRCDHDRVVKKWCILDNNAMYSPWTLRLSSMETEHLSREDVHMCLIHTRISDFPSLLACARLAQSGCRLLNEISHPCQHDHKYGYSNSEIRSLDASLNHEPGLIILVSYR